MKTVTSFDSAQSTCVTDVLRCCVLCCVHCELASCAKNAIKWSLAQIKTRRHIYQFYAVQQQQQQSASYNYCVYQQCGTAAQCTDDLPHSTLMSPSSTGDIRTRLSISTRLNAANFLSRWTVSADSGVTRGCGPPRVTPSRGGGLHPKEEK